MSENTNILGCYSRGPSLHWEMSPEQEELLLKKGESFQSYIWGDKGISPVLKKLNHEDYGKDLILILFQFHLIPLQSELEHRKEIESYRKKEKSIGIPIIVNDENFFDKSEAERYDFLKQSIMQRMDLLAEVVKKKKLDTNMELLKSDLLRILSEI